MMSCGASWWIEADTLCHGASAPAGKPTEQQASARGNLEIKNLAYFFFFFFFSWEPIDLNTENLFKPKPINCFRTESVSVFEYNKILGQPYIYTFHWFLLRQKFKVTILLS